MPAGDNLRLFLHVHNAPDIQPVTGRVAIATDQATIFIDPALVRDISKRLMVSADHLEREAAL